MKTIIAAAVLAAALAGGSAASAEAARPAKPCFYPNRVNGYAPVDDHTVNVRVNGNEIFQLSMAVRPPDVNWSGRIGVQSTGGTAICSKLDAVVIVPGPFGPERYMVDSVRKLTAEEIAALPSKARP